VPPGHACLRPVVRLPEKYEFTHEHGGQCLGCGKSFNSRVAVHLKLLPGCVGIWRERFCLNVRYTWNELDLVLRNALAIKYVYDRIDGSTCGCGRQYAGRKGLKMHLRDQGGDDCFWAGWHGLLNWMDELGDEVEGD